MDKNLTRDAEVKSTELIEEDANKTARYKNIWFWIGLVGVALTAMGIDASTLTTWDSVIQMFKDLISNPFLIGTTALAVIGVFNNPTEKGLRDIK